MLKHVVNISGSSYKVSGIHGINNIHQSGERNT